MICNHSSYVELFYLAFRNAPLFAGVSNNNNAVAQSLFQAFKSTISNKVPEGQGQSLAQLVSESDKNMLGPVVVFPEGITTNGKVLLGCLPVIDSAIAKWRVHVVSFNYDFHEFNPSFSAGNWFVHLFWLCGQFSNKLKAVYVIDADLPDVAETEGGADVTSWADSLYSMLANAAGIRRAKITREVKVPFLDYFYSHKKHYKSS